MGRLYRWVDTQLSKDEEMASGLGLVDLGQWRRLSNRYDSRIAVKLQGGASQSESTVISSCQTCIHYTYWDCSILQWLHVHVGNTGGNCQWFIRH